MGYGISYITFDFLAGVLQLPAGWKISGVKAINNREEIILQLTGTPFNDGQVIHSNTKTDNGCLTGRKHYSCFSWIPLAPYISKFTPDNHGLCTHCKRSLDDHGDGHECS